MSHRHFLMIASLGCALLVNGCSNKRDKKSTQVVARTEPKRETPNPEPLSEKARPACDLDSELVTVVPFSKESFKVPRYLLETHRRVKKERKGVGYENGRDWTYDLTLPTCQPEHPTVTISFIGGHRFRAAGSKARHRIDEKINFQLDHGSCFNYDLVYERGKGVSMSLEKRRDVSRKVSADRSRCVYQARFDREGMA